MTFDVPELPSRFRGQTWYIQLTGSVDVSEDTADAILAAVDASEVAHSTVYLPVTQADRVFELSGMLGVHGSAHSDPPYVHLSTRLELDAKPRERSLDVDWDALFGAVRDQLPAMVMTLSSYFQFPREDGSFGVELPIPLDDLAGFSEISGVRLTQRDPDGNDELYALILSEGVVSRFAQIQTEVELELDDSMLLEGWNRVLAITSLAIEPPMPVEEVE